MSKVLNKQFYVGGEHILKIMSPGTAPTRSENQRKRDLESKMLSVSRTSSPTKGINISQVQAKSSRPQQKSIEGHVKQTLDSKSGGDLR